MMTPDEFWIGVVYADKQMTAEQVRAELHDYYQLLQEVPKVYDHVTGGRLSKPNYTADVVIGEADAYMQRCIDEALGEALEERDGAKNKIKRLRMLLSEAAWYVDRYGDSRKDRHFYRQFQAAASGDAEPTEDEDG